MSMLQRMVALAIASTVCVLGWLLMDQRQANGRLRQENASLTEQLARFSELENDNERLSNLVAQSEGTKPNPQLFELLRLRSEVGALRRQTNEYCQAQEELARLRAGMGASGKIGEGGTNVAREPLAVYPKDKWEFVGYDTPENAFQSLNWAALNGDLGALKSNLTQEAQQEFAKSFENKSESEIRELLSQAFSEKVEARILSKEGINDNLMVLGVSDGKAASSVDKLIFQRINGQWKFVMDH